MRIPGLAADWCNSVKAARRASPDMKNLTDTIPGKEIESFDNWLIYW